MVKSQRKLDDFYNTPVPKTDKKACKAQAETLVELKNYAEDTCIMTKLSSKQHFAFRRIMRKVERGNIRLTRDENLLLQRLRIFHKDTTDPQRRKNIASKLTRKQNTKKIKLTQREKYLKVARSDKLYSSVQNGNKLEAIIRSITIGSIPIAICPHFLIGSSLVGKLLSGKLQIADTHRYLLTTKTRKFGRIAEDCAETMLNNSFLRHQAKLVPHLPFIVASPDFYSQNDKKIIEIKSFEEKQKGVKASILQTVIAMEAFEVLSAEIWFFKTSMQEENVKLVRVIKINKASMIFNEELCKEVILEYIEYLQMILEAMKCTISKEEADKSFYLLEKYSKMKKVFPLIPPPLSQTEFCRKVLQYVQVKIPKTHAPLRKNDFLWALNIERRDNRSNVLQQLRDQVQSKLKDYQPKYTSELFSNCRHIKSDNRSVKREQATDLCGYDRRPDSTCSKIDRVRFTNSTTSVETIHVTIDKNYCEQLLRNGTVIAHIYDYKRTQAWQNVVNG